jgi:hypothetical protein
MYYSPKKRKHKQKEKRLTKKKVSDPILIKYIGHNKNTIYCQLCVRSDTYGSAPLEPVAN